MVQVGMLTLKCSRLKMVMCVPFGSKPPCFKQLGAGGPKSPPHPVSGTLAERWALAKGVVTESEAYQDRTFLRCLLVAHRGLSSLLPRLWDGPVQLHEDLAGPMATPKLLGSFLAKIRAAPRPPQLLLLGQSHRKNRRHNRWKSVHLENVLFSILLCTNSRHTSPDPKNISWSSPTMATSHCKECGNHECRDPCAEANRTNLHESQTARTRTGTQSYRSTQPSPGGIDNAKEAEHDAASAVAKVKAFISEQRNSLEGPPSPCTQHDCNIKGVCRSASRGSRHCAADSGGLGAGCYFAPCSSIEEAKQTMLPPAQMVPRTPSAHPTGA